MKDITDIRIGSVLKWSKKGSPPSKDGNIKNAYFIFLGCYQEDNEWYTIIVRTTSKVSFYIEGKRKHNQYVILDKCQCFPLNSAAGDIDFYITEKANKLYEAFSQGYITNQCNISEDDTNRLKEILINSPQIPEFIKEKANKREISSWLEYLEYVDKNS